MSSQRLLSRLTSMSSSTATRRLAAVSRQMSSTPASSDQEVLHEAQDGIRFITLNRPKALNALNIGMIKSLQDLLLRYHTSSDTAAIVLQGEGRAFCAGGDVVALVKDAQSGDKRDDAVDFFREEYALDNLLARTRKPVVAILDGIVMGGGVGLSVHLPFRIVTEKTVFSMPETTIGLFPDVGANFFLGRMDGHLGRYLALTSEQLKGYAAYHAGVGTHFVPSAHLDDIRRRLVEVSNGNNITLDTIDNLIEEYAADASFLRDAIAQHEPIAGAKRRAIDVCFRHGSAENIVADLRAFERRELRGDTKQRMRHFADADLSEWAKGIADTIERRSPTSVKVALQAVRDARTMTIDQVFRSDMRLAATFCNPSVAPDFVTGVTHQLINKQRDTRAAWKPSTLDAIKDAAVLKTFFEGAPPARVSVPTLEPVGDDAGDDLVYPAYSVYPNAGRALPSEAQLRSMVTGEGAYGMGQFAPRRKDILRAVRKQYGRATGKVGLEEKVDEVLERMCTKKGDKGDELEWDRQDVAVY